MNILMTGAFQLNSEELAALEQQEADNEEDEG